MKESRDRVPKAMLVLGKIVQRVSIFLFAPLWFIIN